MDKVALFFAGQGAQYSGMGKQLYETSPAAKAVFDAAEAMRPGTIEQCFNGSAEELTQTINTQPCLFVVDLACARALVEAGVQPAMTTGFSLGELAASAFTGMLSFEDAFTVVLKRAELMQKAAEKNPGAMAAVLRLEASKVEELCASLPQVYPVNYNAPGQTVVSGSEEGLAQLEQVVKEAGGRVMRLAVGGSFHSPFMAEASDEFRAFLDGFTLAEPALDLYANATAQPYQQTTHNASERATLLAQQIKSPVYFQTTVEHMIAAGATVCIEVGAGKTLCGLIKKIDSSVQHVLNVQDSESLHSTVGQLKELDLC